MTKDGEIIMIWGSIIEAQKKLKIGHISEVCNSSNKNKTAGGYKWKYYD